MARSSILFVDFRRMQSLSEESSIVLRLMMAANDILTADDAQKQVGALESDPSLRRGRGRYFVNLQCGHLSEAVTRVVPSVESSTLLKLEIGRCQIHVRDAYAQLVDLSPAGTKHDRFVKTMKALRDKLTFHYYDREKKLLAKGLDSCAKRPSQRISKIIYSESGSRFVAADVINDEIVTRHLWKISDSDDVEVASNARLEEMNQWDSDVPSVRRWLRAGVCATTLYRALNGNPSSRRVTTRCNCRTRRNGDSRP